LSRRLQAGCFALRTDIVPPMLPSAEDFPKLRREDAPWRVAVREIAARHDLDEPWVRAAAGSAVVFLGSEHVIKLLPPRGAADVAIEAASLRAFAGQLPVATPQLLGHAVLDGWPYLITTRLHGTELRVDWDSLPDEHRLSLVRETAELLDAMHRVPLPSFSFPDAWRLLERPVEQIVSKHERDGVDHSWTDAIAAVLSRHTSPETGSEPTALVHGDVQPDHLLLDPEGHLCGLFDFGDVMAGPAVYDLAATACLMAAHVPGGAATLFEAYGACLDDGMRERLTVALLKQRYCALPFVVRTFPGHRRPGSLEELLGLVHGDQ